MVDNVSYAPLMGAKGDGGAPRASESADRMAGRRRQPDSRSSGEVAARVAPRLTMGAAKQ
jgi:hypothetical protein